MSRPRTPDTVKAARKIEELSTRLAAARAERDAAIVASWRAGTGTVSTLADEAGVTRQTVYNALWRENIHTSRRVPA